MEALPSAAKKLKHALTQGSIRANLTAPILQGGQFLGFVGIDFVDGPRTWSAGDIDLCEHVSSALGLALLRLDAENNMRVAYDLAHHAEQNLLDAIECLPEGFVLYDADGNLEVCNDRFREDYRYTVEDAHPGVHFTDLGRIDISRGRISVPSGYKRADDYLETRRIYRTKLEGTFPVTLADGRYLMTRDSKTSSGGLVSIQTDITRIKKTEESLRLSERKFWSVFHASPSPMTIAGLEDGRFVDVNAKWSEIMGFEYTDVIGATAMELDVWPSQLPHMMVDRTKFKQIIINLLSNAVKYNVESGTISVGVTPKGQTMLAVTVSDTGHGMTPKSCEALFEPFQRLGAEKGNVEGTGLGLVLAKRMIEAMDGAILVESAPGIGSTFTLTVPIAK